MFAVVYVRDTIAAIATPAGAGGIAIIRVSGGAARAVAEQVFRGWPSTQVESHRLYAGRIVDCEDVTIDRALAALMLAPRSYTGEDVLELHCHGGVAVARAVLRSVLAGGARLAERGEFTSRAFLNGKLDLTQVEAVADLVAARTEEAARVAGAQLDGSLSRRIHELRGGVTEIAARLEAAIDFADEDGTGLDRPVLEARMEAVIDDLQSLLATYERGRLLREGAKVVIVGKPNVGKSSLMNVLLGTDRVIVTPIAGTTRDTVEERLDIDGVAVSITDTAGLRESADLVERFGVERTRSVIREADLVLLVLDASRALDEDDRAAAVAVRGRPVVSVLNKTDLEERIGASEARAEFPGADVIRASVMTRSGIDELLTCVREKLFGESEPHRDTLVTRDRQRRSLDEAVEALRSARTSLRIGDPAEIVAVHVRAVSTSLAEIVGAITNDQVLDWLFREFCVGK